jgi:anti-sigma regulatory factor (Ser/Thr protein kinase)
MMLGATERFRRVPEAVPAAREFLRRFLPARAKSQAMDELVLAASEAMNNVIEHATGGEFLISVATDGTRARVVVTDAGTGWQGPRRDPVMPEATETAGRGLALMHMLVDRAQVTSTPAGTTVALQHGLADRPAAANQPVWAHA